MGCLENSHSTSICIHFCVHTHIHATGRSRYQQLITALTMCRLSPRHSLTSLILRGRERGTHLPKAKQLETKLEGAREAPSVGAYILVVTDTRKSAANPTSDPAKRDPRDRCAPGQGLKAGSAAEWSGESRGG